MQAGTYRIAPELRRCCWYCIVAAPMLAAVQGYFAQATGWRPRGFESHSAAEYILLNCVFFAILAIVLALPLLWRIRVDEHGVERRRIFARDRWSWDAFASGRVVKQFGYTFFDAARPWGRRRLRLDYLASEERASVMDAINAHYRLPAPPLIPEKLTVQLGFRKQASFDASGIHLDTRGIPRFYRWDEVQRLLIERHDPLRRDFVTLELVLPDSVVELSHIYHDAGRATPNWHGASAEEVNEGLLRFTSADKVEVGNLGDPVIGFALRHKRLSRLKSNLRQLEWIMALGCMALLIPGIMIGMEKGTIAGTLMTVIALACFGPIFYMIRRRLCEQIRDIEQ